MKLTMTYVSHEHHQTVLNSHSLTLPGGPDSLRQLSGKETRRNWFSSDEKKIECNYHILLLMGRNEKRIICNLYLLLFQSLRWLADNIND